MSRRVRRATATAAVVMTLLLGACNDADAPAGSAGPPTATRTAKPAVETVVRLGRVTGRLPAEARTRLARQVGSVVDGWVKAAYLAGDYPRRGFSDSWPGFTAGAQALARRDRALMSNQDIGERIDDVRARRSQVRLDVLAVRQHAVGVTARVVLGFRTTGTLERDVRVRGRLYLTHTGRGWQVFGYDVTKGAV
jgi:hypothetical protein